MTPLLFTLTSRDLDDHIDCELEGPLTDAVPGWYEQAALENRTNPLFIFNNYHRYTLSDNTSVLRRKE